MGRWKNCTQSLVAKFRLATMLDGAEVVFKKGGCDVMSTSLEDMADRLDYYEQRERRHPVLSALMDALDLWKAGRQK